MFAHDEIYILIQAYNRLNAKKCTQKPDSSSDEWNFLAQNDHFGRFFLDNKLSNFYLESVIH